MNQKMFGVFFLELFTGLLLGLILAFLGFFSAYTFTADGNFGGYGGHIGVAVSLSVLSVVILGAMVGPCFLSF